MLFMHYSICERGSLLGFVVKLVKDRQCIALCSYAPESPVNILSCCRIICSATLLLLVGSVVLVGLVVVLSVA